MYISLSLYIDMFVYIYIYIQREICIYIYIYMLNIVLRCPFWPIAKMCTNYESRPNICTCTWMSTWTCIRLYLCVHWVPQPVFLAPQSKLWLRAQVFGSECSGALSTHRESAHSTPWSRTPPNGRDAKVLAEEPHTRTRTFTHTCTRIGIGTRTRTRTDLDEVKAMLGKLTNRFVDTFYTYLTCFLFAYFLRHWRYTYKKCLNALGVNVNTFNTLRRL